MLISSLEQRIAGMMSFWRLAVLGCILVLIFIVISIFATPTGDIMFNFEEGGTVTALSSLFLAMGGAMGFIAYFIGYNRDDAARYLVLLLACGLTFFCMDEQIQLHEAVDALVLKPALGEVPGLRSWNDLIVIGYGLVGLAVLWFFRGAFLSSPRFTALFVVAFGLYAAHTAIDSIVIEQTAWKVVPEESFKLMCVYFLFLTMASKLLDLVMDVIGGRRSKMPL